MFTSIEQGMEVYRAQLKEYAAFNDRLYKKYGDKLRELGAMHAFSDDEWDKLTELNTKCAAMESVLGLSPAEAEAMYAEFSTIS